MQTFAVFTAGLIMFATVGCRDSATSEVLPTVTDSPQRQRPKPPELQDIGTPDGAQRELDGIQVTGSALTDAHIAAIKSLTDATKPTKPNRYLIRGIEHTGPNTATHTWQTGGMQVNQKLLLDDGAWTVHEEGGGFGHW